MTHTLPRQRTSQVAAEDVHATVRAIAGAVAAEHALALRAATEASLSRRSVAELRAMYVPVPGARTGRGVR